MKHNWEYKKLGECGIVVTGNTPSKKDAANYSSNDFCFVKPNDIEKDGVTYINQTCEYISKKAFEKSRRLPKGAVLTTCIGIIGKVAILEVDATCNQQINAIIPNGNVNSKFLAYSILSIRNYLTQKANAPVVPIINKGDFSEILIPVPPLSEQSRIVAELDLLTGIIDKQNAQLKELDNLAQSIFYDMFGDPIENPKGWDVKKLGDVAQDIFAGGDKPEDCSDQLSEEYRYPVIANGVGDRGVLGYSKEYRVGVDAVTVGARGASIGNCRICKAFFTPVVRLITIIPGVNFDIVYLFYAVQLLNFNINGAGQAQLTVPNVKSQNVVVPPLALQQSFAEKIQSIENQKETIRASIADTQKLLDYTMDKYFG